MEQQLKTETEMCLHISALIGEENHPVLRHMLTTLSQWLEKQSDEVQAVIWSVVEGRHTVVNRWMTKYNMEKPQQSNQHPSSCPFIGS